MDEITSDSLLLEIEKTLQSISYGSIEIFVQDGTVTQITVRKIKKTRLAVKKSQTHINNIYKNGTGKSNAQRIVQHGS